jgi:hypothetical protein
VTLHIPRLGLSKWLSLPIAGVIMVAVLWNWPVPHQEGKFTKRIGFSAAERGGAWSVQCAASWPEPGPDAESVVRGTIVVEMENIYQRRFFGFRVKMAVRQTASARTQIDELSGQVDELRARAAVEHVRFDLAAAAEGVHSGVEEAVINEPAVAEKILWANLAHHAAMLVIIGGLWWVLGGPRKS